VKKVKIRKLFYDPRRYLVEKRDWRDLKEGISEFTPQLLLAVLLATDIVPWT
jgi:hypothetical protein